MVTKVHDCYQLQEAETTQNTLSAATASAAPHLHLIIEVALEVPLPKVTQREGPLRLSFHALVAPSSNVIMTAIGQRAKLSHVGPFTLELLQLLLQTWGRMAGFLLRHTLLLWLPLLLPMGLLLLLWLVHAMSLCLSLHETAEKDGCSGEGRSFLIGTSVRLYLPAGGARKRHGVARQAIKT